MLTLTFNDVQCTVELIMPTLRSEHPSQCVNKLNTIFSRKHILTFIFFYIICSIEDKYVVSEQYCTYKTGTTSGMLSTLAGRVTSGSYAQIECSDSDLPWRTRKPVKSVTSGAVMRSTRSRWLTVSWHPPLNPMLLTPVPDTSTRRNLRWDPLPKNQEWITAN